MTEPGPPPATDPEQPAPEDQVPAAPDGRTTLTGDDAVTGREAVTGGDAVSGWVPPQPSAPSRPRRALAWVATAIVLALGALLAYRLADGTDSYRLGVAIGTALAPLLFAFLIFLVAMLLRRRPWRDAYRSPWLPLATLILLVFALSGAFSRAAAPPPADPATALRIAPPWTLDLEESATLDQIESRVTTNDTVRSGTARHIAGPDGTSAFLLVTDSALRPDASIDELARGLAEGSKGSATIETIGDQKVVLVVLNGAAIASWVESPFLVTVYAADVGSARTLASAVLEADSP